MVVAESETEQPVDESRASGQVLDRKSGNGWAAGLRAAVKGPVQPAGRDFLRAPGNSQAVHPRPLVTRLVLRTGNRTLHPSLRAKKTQWSIGLGSLKYMTPPSFPSSAGITLKPRSSMTPSTSSTS